MDHWSQLSLLMFNQGRCDEEIQLASLGVMK